MAPEPVHARVPSPIQLWTDQPPVIVIDGFVYDVTEFSKRHPGGSMPFKTFAGKCCSCKSLPPSLALRVSLFGSGQFHKIHSLETLQRHEDLRIGWTGDVSNPYEKPAPKVVKPLWFRHWH